MKTALISKTFLFAVLSAVQLFAAGGEEILARMDKNRNHETIEYKGTMAIRLGDKVRTKKMKAKAINGSKTKAVVEFTNAEDRGTKYLMIGSDLWIYFPSENDVVKISGHMLKDGMMGSDVSYEDALESDELSEKYSVSVPEEEKVDGKEYHVLLLEAKEKSAPYAKRKMWVNKETFVAEKEQMYAKSGKLLKVSRVLETGEIDGRIIPVKTEMSNKLRKNSRTVFTMTDISFDKKYDKNEFSMRYLRR
ncbi:MAG: outer membrane lipoprotein-sorting protein [Chitinispirillaceae bacterium]